MTREDVRNKYDSQCKYDMNKIDGGYAGCPSDLPYIEWLEDKIIELCYLTDRSIDSRLYLPYGTIINNKM